MRRHGAGEAGSFAQIHERKLEDIAANVTALLLRRGMSAAEAAERLRSVKPDPTPRIATYAHFVEAWGVLVDALDALIRDLLPGWKTPIDRRFRQIVARSERDLTYVLDEADEAALRD